MADKKRYKFTRVGTVLKSNEGEGSYIALGNNKSKDEQYNYSVEITVRNSKGEVVAKQKDGFLGVYDPRKNAKRAANVPDVVLFEISMREEA